MAKNEDLELYQLKYFEAMFVRSGKYDWEMNNNKNKNKFQTKYLPVIIFGCETWILINRLKSKLQAIEIKYLKIIGGVMKEETIKRIKLERDFKLIRLITK